MKAQWPDVIVLDVEMPRMDGITFLRRIMAERAHPGGDLLDPSPKGSGDGAAGPVGRRRVRGDQAKVGLKQFLHDRSDDLISAVKAAAVQCAAPGAQRAPAPSAVAPKLSADAILPAARRWRRPPRRWWPSAPPPAAPRRWNPYQALPRVSPGIVVVQHMPEKFHWAFAQRLDGLCEVEVREARHGTG